MRMVIVGLVYFMLVMSMWPRNCLSFVIVLQQKVTYVISTKSVISPYKAITSSITLQSWSEGKLRKMLSSLDA